jgi:hypothetical protein
LEQDINIIMIKLFPWKLWLDGLKTKENVGV